MIEIYITQKLKRELVLKIDPEKYYPVNYIILQNGSKVMKSTYLKGKDLTERQIINLYKQGEI